MLVRMIVCQSFASALARIIYIRSAGALPIFGANLLISLDIAKNLCATILPASLTPSYFVICTLQKCRRIFKGEGLIITKFTMNYLGKLIY